MSIDLNQAGEQRSMDLIPQDTAVPVIIKVRGDSLDGLKRSKSGTATGLDLELTVTEGPYARRKLFPWLTRSGETEGHVQAVEIANQTLRAILESARGVRPDDKSEAAKAARCIDSYLDLEGMQFWARVGIEPARDGYDAKNKLASVITPDRKGWTQLEQPARSAPPSPSASSSVSVAKIAKPGWADKKKKAG